MELVPQGGIGGQLHLVDGVVEQDACPLVDDVRLYAQTVDAWRGAQGYAAHDAVPVALGLVGDAVGVLPHPDIFYAVVDGYLQRVATAILQIRCDVVLVGHGERHLVTHLVTIDQQRGLYVGTLQGERDLLAAPRLGYLYRAAIPGAPDIVARGR